MLTVKKLGSLLQRPPLSVEIIPGDGTEWTSSFTDNEPSIKEHHPFLLVEGNLGVPEKLLYKAYMSSIPLLMQSRHCTTSPTVSSADHGQEDLANSTAIILLANPAHQTAINARKRLVELSVLDTQAELGYVTALLAVRSCAKQTIMWRYRRWLLLQVHGSYPTPRSPTGFPVEDSLLGLAMPVESWRHEFSVISQACETYPRNYFAWSHRYLCAKALCALSLEQAERSRGYLSVLTDEITSAKRWIELHVSDYSAMQYLCMLHSSMHSTTKQLPDQPPAYTDDDIDLVTHAYTLVDAYPGHEALWLYLRGALMTSGLWPGTSGVRSPSIFQKVDALVQEIHAMSGEGRLQYPHSRRIAPDVDSELIHRYSTRFLRWQERESKRPSNAV